MCPYLNKWVYKMCTGNIYGKQVGAKVWKDKVHSDLTSADFGFIEIQNTHSLYYHPVRDIKLSMHVDNPLMAPWHHQDRHWHIDIRRQATPHWQCSECSSMLPHPLLRQHAAPSMEHHRMPDGDGVL